MGSRSEIQLSPPAACRRPEAVQRLGLDDQGGGVQEIVVAAMLRHEEAHHPVRPRDLFPTDLKAPPDAITGLGLAVQRDLADESLWPPGGTGLPPTKRIPLAITRSPG